MQFERKNAAETKLRGRDRKIKEEKQNKQTNNKNSVQLSSTHSIETH